MGLSAETLIGGRMVTREEARATLSGFKPVQVDELSIRSTGKHWICHGCNMIFRASLFEQELFDENLPLYSYAEDYDFSIRAARHGIVGRVAGVGFVHLEHSSGRVSEKRRGYSMVANNYYFLKKGVCHLSRWKGYIRFWLVIVLKETLLDTLSSLTPIHRAEMDYRGRAIGRLMAIKDLFLRRSSPLEILNYKRFQ
jgi:GT2 family glycosyltransferase